MNELNIYRDIKLLHSIKSSVVPPVGSKIWINSTSEYLKVIDVIYDLNTYEKKIVISVMVE